MAARCLPTVLMRRTAACGIGANPACMITDTATAIDRVVRMVKEQKVTAYTGEDIPVVAHSVCVHGDGARALEFVQALRSAFAENGIAVAPLAEVIADV